MIFHILVVRYSYHFSINLLCIAEYLKKPVLQTDFKMAQHVFYQMSLIDFSDSANLVLLL